jgi:hypothetical protein
VGIREINLFSKMSRWFEKAQVVATANFGIALATQVYRGLQTELAEPRWFD